MLFRSVGTEKIKKAPSFFDMMTIIYLRAKWQKTQFYKRGTELGSDKLAINKKIPNRQKGIEMYFLETSN